MKIDISDIQYFLNNYKYRNRLPSKEFELVVKYGQADFKESFEDFLKQNNYESPNLVFLIKDAVIGYKKFMDSMQTIKHKSWGEF